MVNKGYQKQFKPVIANQWSQMMNSDTNKRDENGKMTLLAYLVR